MIDRARNRPTCASEVNNLARAIPAAPDRRDNAVLAEACERFGIAYGTAKNAAMVSAAFSERSLRRDLLDFAHHQTVANDSQAAELLDVSRFPRRPAAGTASRAAPVIRSRAGEKTAAEICGSFRRRPGAPVAVIPVAALDGSRAATVAR